MSTPCQCPRTQEERPRGTRATPDGPSYCSLRGSRTASSKAPLSRWYTENILWLPYFGSRGCRVKCVLIQLNGLESPQRVVMKKHGLVGSVVFGLSFKVAALPVLITATLPPPYNTLFGAGPTLYITYEDHNANGLFDVDELLYFSATPRSTGSGSAFTIYNYTALLTVPAIPNVSNAGALATSFNGISLAPQCDFSWCLGGTIHRLGQPTPWPEYVSIFSVEHFNYAVGPVPEPSSLWMSGLGVTALAMLLSRRRRPTKQLIGARYA